MTFARLVRRDVRFIFLIGGGSSGEGAGNWHPPPPPPPPQWQGSWQLVFCKIFRYVWYVFSAVLIMLLPSQTLSSSYLLSNLFMSPVSYAVSGAPLLRKILDPLDPAYSRRLESLTVCRCYYNGSTLSSVILKTLSIGPAGIWTSGLPLNRQVLIQLS